MTLMQKMLPAFLAAAVVCYLYYTFSSIHQDLHYVQDMKKETDDLVDVSGKIKYILQWTPRKTAPFDSLEVGRKVFIRNKCKHTNCFITEDRDALMSVANFDAIIFNGKDVIKYRESDMPDVRSAHQKYIFAAMESSHYYPACDPVFDNFFNWTWTYRLDSDFRWGYITIYDLNGTAVGPKSDMMWPKMDPIGEDIKSRLKGKTKAAAWFVSNCHSLSKREDVAARLNEQLKVFGLELDVYGACGSLSCARKEQNKCSEMVQHDYYFYLSFENSFAEDYVTEKLLTALDNYAVPVVFGGADYTRFLPPGSYLDAKQLSAQQLALTMRDIMSNKTRYHEFFRWRNHFKYKDTAGNYDTCQLCAMMNDEKAEQYSLIGEFRRWWNGDLVKGLCAGSKWW